MTPMGVMTRATQTTVGAAAAGVEAVVAVGAGGSSGGRNHPLFLLFVFFALNHMKPRPGGSVSYVYLFKCICLNKYD